MFAWGLRHVNVKTVAAGGGGGRRQGPKRQLTLTRVDVTKVYYKIHHFERYALRSELFIQSRNSLQQYLHVRDEIIPCHTNYRLYAVVP